MRERLRKPATFLGITFSISWSIAILFYLLGGTWNTLSATVLAVGIMFVPMISAIITQKLIYNKPIKEPLGISFNFNKWWLIAWFLPPIIAFLTLGISLLFPGVNYAPEMTGFLETIGNFLTSEQTQQIKDQLANLPIHPIWIVLVQGLFAGVTVNAIAAFGEELGWRGFLLKELDFMNFWKTSIIIGAIWGVWHMPLILQGHNYPQNPILGVFMMIIWTILLTPIFCYIRIKSKSVIPAAIMHGTINATAGISILLVKGGGELLVGLTGAAGFITLIIVNILIFSFDKDFRKNKVRDLMNI